jgi:hypothetical protein
MWVVQTELLELLLEVYCLNNCQGSRNRNCAGVVQDADWAAGFFKRGHDTEILLKDRLASTLGLHREWMNGDAFNFPLPFSQMPMEHPPAFTEISLNFAGNVGELYGINKNRKFYGARKIIQSWG